MNILLGKKKQMTQLWKEDKVIPVTVIQVPANTVSLVRTKERDGYEAVQLTMGKTRREFREKSGNAIPWKEGDSVSVSVFKEGDLVHVAGVMKGRGFQGVVKRHGFHGGPKTHGQKNRFRAPGSIGSTAPQHLFLGRRMGGHMGDTRVTMKNLKVAGVDEAKGLLYVRGAVPGARGGLLEIRKTVHGKSKS